MERVGSNPTPFFYNNYSYYLLPTNRIVIRCPVFVNSRLFIPELASRHLNFKLVHNPLF